MKTVKTTRTETETGRIEFGYWDPENDEFIPVRSDADITRVAELFGVNPLLVQCLVYMFEQTRDFVVSDLMDIWEKLERE